MQKTNNSDNNGIREAKYCCRKIRLPVSNKYCETFMKRKKRNSKKYTYKVYTCERKVMLKGGWPVFF